jgi:hypothetical protein
MFAAKSFYLHSSPDDISRRSYRAQRQQKKRAAWRLPGVTGNWVGKYSNNRSLSFTTRMTQPIINAF